MMQLAEGRCLSTLQEGCKSDEQAVALQVGDAALERCMPHIDLGPVHISAA